jgi:hypothetical protein
MVVCILSVMDVLANVEKNSPNEYNRDSPEQQVFQSQKIRRQKVRECPPCKPERLLHVKHV